jgi:transglutaminase-like putative cysteine protease
MPLEFRAHQDASRVPRDSSVRVLTFTTLREKAAWLDASASLDALRGGIQDFVRRFLDTRDPETRARQIQRWVRDHIHYEHDYRVIEHLPGEEFADSETVLERGYDDCDGKARLFVALVRAAEILRPLGLAARIRPVFRKHPLDFVHVQAEVLFHGSKVFPNAEPDGWIITELILKGCELGQNPDDCPRGPHGERLLA